jgi:hypothetical protein
VAIGPFTDEETRQPQALHLSFEQFNPIGGIMAEKLLLVCDICGAPAAETVTFNTSGGNRQKDYCATHLQELLRGSRVPKRGRKPGTTRASTSGRTKTAAKRTGGRTKTAARKATGSQKGHSKNGKRLGRPPGSGRKKATARKAKAGS